MKSDEPNLPSLDDDLLDLLVDDELSESQRRELLRLLEEKPDGWRRCALAFLEAQCWKREFRHVVPPASPTSVEQPAVSAPLAPPPRARERRSRLGVGPGTVLAMAASFLVALLIGSQVRLGGPSDPPLDPRGLGPADLAQAGRGTAGPASQDPWRMVTLTSNDANGNQQSVRLPAKEEDHLDASWWRSPAPAIPEEVLRALKSSGHEVRQSRQFLPVPMQDGRKLVVPVDQVDVDYVGNPQYQ